MSSTNKYKNILSSIKDTQEKEDELIRTLPIDSEKRKEMLNKIQQLSNLRIELLTTLFTLLNQEKNVISNEYKAISSIKETLAHKESELNDKKAHINNKKGEHDKTLRLIEITRYESERYKYLTRILRLLSIVLVGLLVNVILYKLDLLPNEIHVALFLVIVIIGGFFLYRYISDYVRRDRHDFSRYQQTTRPHNKNYETVFEHDRKFIDQIVNDLNIDSYHSINKTHATSKLSEQQKSL
jgi:hypothetical protein